MRRYSSAVFIPLLFFIAACSYPHISVQTEYLTMEHLASFYVGTPDPRLQNPPIGQRLIISWSLPHHIYCDDLIMKLKIRYRNREEEEHSILLKKRCGTYLFDLLNERYCQLGGILTYKIEIWSGDSLLEEWKHQLWTELIIFENIDDDNPK